MSRGGNDSAVVQLQKKQIATLTRLAGQIAIVNKILISVGPLLIPYRRRSKWGYCSPDKQIVIECIYEDAALFSQGFAPVRYNNKWGFIDGEGEQLTPFIYYNVSIFSEGLAAVVLNNKLGYLDLTGKIVIPCIYKGFIWESSRFSEGLAAVELNGKFGFIDGAGNQKIPFLFNDVMDSFRNGVAWVETADDSEGYNSERFASSLADFYIDRNGKHVTLDPKNDYFFSEGLRSYALPPKMKYGFVDKGYAEIISCTYEYARNFSEGLAAVQLDGKWGFINKTGELAISCIFEAVEDFSGGLSRVKFNGIHGYINQNGVQYWED